MKAIRRLIDYCGELVSKAPEGLNADALGGLVAEANREAGNSRCATCGWWNTGTCENTTAEDKAHDINALYIGEDFGCIFWEGKE